MRQRPTRDSPSSLRHDAMADPLPTLSTADLEILLTALDPLLDGFSNGASCLDDARAFLERLDGDGQSSGPLRQWLQSWQAAGGNRDTLRLMVSTLLAERLATGDGHMESSSPASDPASGETSGTANAASRPGEEPQPPPPAHDGESA